MDFDLLMNSNTTNLTNVPSSHFDNATNRTIDGQKIFQYVLYIVNGVSAAISSLLIMTVILSNAQLRCKDYYLLCGLAGGDMSQAIAFLYSGIRRMSLVITGRDESVLVTPFACMEEFYNSFFIFGQECSMLMTFCISLDRFLAITAYDRYRTFGTRYARIMIGCVYAHCSVVIAVGWYVSYYELEQTASYQLICFTPYAVPTLYYSYHGLAQLSPGLGSIVLYGAALSAASRIGRQQRVGPSSIEFTSVQLVERRRQAQLTKNVAIVVFYTFFSTTVPFGVIFFFNTLGLKTSSSFTTIAPYMWAISCVDGGMNIFIYARKYPKFRACLKKLLRIESGRDGSLASGTRGGGAAAETGMNHPTNGQKRTT